MKKYDKYKDSGVEWIGQVPEHWDRNRLKYLISCNSEVLPESTDKDNLIKYVEISDVDISNGINSYSTISFGEAPSRARRITHINDVIVSTVRTYLRAIATIQEEDLIVSTGFAVLTPNKDDITPKFLSYYVLSETFIGNVIANSTGVSYPAISSTDLLDLSIVLPPLVEQEAIAAYLDEKTGQIDALMAEKSEQLKDLQALRTSIITEAVTKGLNPNAPMKDSGIEWIGQVPESWETRKIKTILEKSNDSMKVGPFGSALSGNDFTDEGYWVYNQRTILDNNFETNTVFISKEKFDEMQGFAVKAGDFLITTRGTIGKVVIVPEQHQPGILHPCVIRFRIDNKQAYPTYLRYIFNDSNLVSEQVLYNSNSTTIEVIYSYTLKELLIPLPSLSEQRAIAAYLDEKTSEIDAMKAELTAQIEDLKTLRTSLITEAVTGQVDVRDWKTKH